MYIVKKHDGITKWESILITDNYNEANELYEKISAKISKEVRVGGVSLFQDGKHLKTMFIPNLEGKIY